MPYLPVKSRKVVAVSLLLVVALGLCGCGGTGLVSGTVTSNGQNVRSGVITFVNKDGEGAVMASIKKDGTYKAFNVPVGDTVVILVNAMEEPDFKAPSNAAEAAKIYGKASGRTSMPTVIPQQFGKPETSGLAFTVQSGDNHFDIEVGK